MTDKSDRGDLVFKIIEDARVPARMDNGGASEDDGTAAWNRWFSASFKNHGAELRQEIYDTVSEAFAILAEEGGLDRYDKQIQALQTEIAELRGRLDTLMTLMQKGADVAENRSTTKRRERASHATETATRR